jgi:hypothetical protein
MGHPTCTLVPAGNAVYGTAGDDRVHIAKAEGADGLKGLYKVEINGQTRLMDRQELENTRFELGAGDDTVAVDADVTAKVAVNGGTGTTRVVGGNGNVVDVGGPDRTVLPEPFRIPGTPLVVIPLAPSRHGESLSLFGMQLPFRSARITNESCISSLPALPGRPGEVPAALQGQATQPGQPAATVPRFAVTVHADRASVDVTDRVPLSLRPGVVTGTPLGGKGDEANVRRHELLDPSLALGKRAFATATLSMRDDYPTHFTSPTEVSITATSENLATITPKLEGDRLDFGTVGRIRANAFGIGGARAEVRASLDLARIDTALAPLGLGRGEARVLRQDLVALVKAKVEQWAARPDVADALSDLRPGGDFAKSLKQIIDRHLPSGAPAGVVDKVVGNVLAEVTHPGVSAQGPMFLGLPVGYGYFSAETTRHTRAPFEGSGIGTPFPATLATVGPTLVPAGVISDFPTPAGGATLARDWDSLALSATIAAKPSLEPGSIGVAGVAAARAGFRLGGLDVTLEAGWRGRAALGGSATSPTDDATARGIDAMGSARRAAEARFAEQAEGSEQGVFRPDLQPAEVTSPERPSAEFFAGVRIKKSF